MADREMTNQEAIEILGGIRACYNIFDEYDEPKYAALSKAIFALKAEPTYEQIVDYCKKRDLTLIPKDTLRKLQTESDSDIKWQGRYCIECLYSSTCYGAGIDKPACKSFVPRVRYVDCSRIDGDKWEEPEINPCRGCDDYDGRGGCKSNGGCGADMRGEEDG